jgi:hypothetical protein
MPTSAGLLVAWTLSILKSPAMLPTFSPCAAYTAAAINCNPHSVSTQSKGLI